MYISALNNSYIYKKIDLNSDFKTNPINFSAKNLLFDEIDEAIKNNDSQKVKELPDCFIVNKKMDTLLHSAARNNKTDISRYLLFKKLSPDAKNNNGKTPFAIACSKGNLELVKNFLLYKPNVNTKDNMGNTPLHQSIEYPDIVELLLKYKADPYALNEFEETPFRLSVINVKSLEKFLKQNVNPNTANKKNETLMHYAVKKEDLVLADKLKEYRADVNYKNIDGRSPLFFAKSPKTVKWLIENGAKIDIVDKDKKTPLHYSVTENNPMLTKEFLKQNANPNILDKDNLPPLAYSKSFGMLKLLLQNSAHPDVIMQNGTILHSYTKRQDLKSVDLLLKYNANPNIPDQNGYIPLDYTKSNECRKMLLKGGTNPNYREYLIFALKSKDFEFFSNLLEYGADTNKTNSKGFSAVFFINNEKELDELIKHDANINLRNNYGFTPVQHFALIGKTDLMKKLVAKGAFVEEPQNAGSLKHCIEKYNNYHSWIKSEKTGGSKVSFKGDFDYKLLGTEKIRKHLNTQVQLTKEQINNIVENASSTDRGIVDAYNKLRDEEKLIIEAIKDLSVIQKHFGIETKDKLSDLLRKNPTGSKLPIIGPIRQHTEVTVSDNFFNELKDEINKLRDCLNDITENYFTKNLEKRFKDYAELNQYLSDGVSYVNYIKGTSPTREKILQGLEISAKNCEIRKANLENNIENLNDKYENAYMQVLQFQKDKQKGRTARKTVMLIFSLLGVPS